MTFQDLQQAALYQWHYETEHCKRLLFGDLAKLAGICENILQGTAETKELQRFLVENDKSNDA
jgi:hypothetical protein